MDLIGLVYVGLLIFVGVQVKNILENRKKALHNRRSFKVRGRLLMVISASILLVLGAIQLVGTPKGTPWTLWVMNLIVLLVAVGLLWIAQDQTVLSDEGIYTSGRFTPWDEIKQWSFLNGDKVLQLNLVPRARAKNLFVQIRPEDKVEISMIIQSYKAKKKNRVKKTR